jgi:hypothetical protein
VVFSAGYRAGGAAIGERPDWLKLVGISKQTGLRLRAAGQAPRFWQLSPNRIGTTVAKHRAWLASRDQAEVLYDADTLPAAAKIKPESRNRGRSA